MIAILDNLVSLMTLLAGYVLGDLIIVLRTPAGFIALSSLIVFVGQLIIRDVLKDIKTINIKKILSSVKIVRVRRVSPKRQSPFHDNDIVINSM